MPSISRDELRTLLQYLYSAEEMIHKILDEPEPKPEPPKPEPPKPEPPKPEPPSPPLPDTLQSVVLPVYGTTGIAYDLQGKFWVSTSTSWPTSLAQTVEDGQLLVQFADRVPKDGTIRIVMKG